MTTAFYWFRQDLRLADNPALTAAVAENERVLPVYIHAPGEAGEWASGGAGRWWLHHSLKALDHSLQQRGSRLVVRQGDSLAVIRTLLAESGAERVYWNRRYAPAEIARDTEIKHRLRADGVAVRTCNGMLINEPWAVRRDADQPYRVFTPYWRAVQKQGLAPLIQPAPRSLPPVAPDVGGLSVEALELLPRVPWDSGLRAAWEVGEEAAQRRLTEFLHSALNDYAEARNRPDIGGTSRLSPYLHFGEISPRQILHAVRMYTAAEASPGVIKNAESYVRELIWREFAYHLLFHFPETAEHPLDARFEAFPWAADYGTALSLWQRGATGYPLIDAGMRELWHTGWMHNRVRMVVASFLTKNLLIPWQEGARWFWDTLVDADLANNTLGWQWTAGCGADAAPYFRVFNPVLQGERFDAEGDYVRRWIPEIAGLPRPYCHRPWSAPAGILEAHGIRLGATYPHPLIDLAESRTRALAAFKRLKTMTGAVGS